MLWGWFAWIVFLREIHNASSGEPPLITDFQSNDLNQPGDVLSGSGLRLSCKATGASPLEYRWQHNGRDIEYGEQYRLLKSGTLEGTLLSPANDGYYQCFVKNDFGEDFSRKLKVVVSVAGGFYFANDKIAPVTLGKPVEIPCPTHEPSFGVTYRWGGYSSAGDPSSFLPLLENDRIAVTLDGTLVVMFVTIQDAYQVNKMGGILCEMSLGSETKYSHVVDFKRQGNEFKGFTAPSIYVSPKPQEEVREGYQKKLYCLGVAKPPPYIIWKKDGEKIEDGEDGYQLPADHYNRLLIIKEVTKEHQGNYTCTAYSNSGSFDRASVATFLTVKVSPEWQVELPLNTSVARSQTTSLRCVARGAPPPFYRWFRNGQEIDVSDSRVKLQKNILKLINVDGWHEAVFQCVAENNQGMSVTSTWVHVEDSPTNVGPSSRREVDSDQLLWIILSAVFGVLLIVSIVVVIVCYRRRKKSRRDQERPRTTEETSHYNDILDDIQGNPSQPHAAPSGVKGVKGIRRHPTLPPIPQYQTLEPSTAGVANYEPLAPGQDLNDSGLYEKLDFRSLDNGPDYDNPGKAIPEYLELVNETNVPPGNTASTVTTGEPGKEYYQPMEGGLRNDVFNDSNSAPKYYVPMEIEGSKTKTPIQPSPSSPKYYEPIPGNLESAPKGSTSSAEYYQPMADKAAVREQGEDSFSCPEYYVPMAENSLSEPAVQTSNTQAECSEGTKENSCSSKL